MWRDVGVRSESVEATTRGWATVAGPEKVPSRGHLETVLRVSALI